MVKTLTGNIEGIYIDPTNGNAHVDEQQCINFHEVSMEGVNHLVIRRSHSGEMKVIQANGYTPDRGIFVDLY